MFDTWIDCDGIYLEQGSDRKTLILYVIKNDKAIRQLRFSVDSIGGVECLEGVVPDELERASGSKVVP